MDEGIVGSDIYLRHDRGPAQHFRVWDRAKFLESQVQQGIDATDKDRKPAPYIVSVATREEYLAEHKRK